MSGAYSVDITQEDVLLHAKLIQLQPGETLTFHVTTRPDHRPSRTATID